MLFVASSVALGTVGTPLEHSGKLEACQLLSFEEGLGARRMGRFLVLPTMLRRADCVTSHRSIRRLVDPKTSYK